MKIHQNNIIKYDNSFWKIAEIINERSILETILIKNLFNDEEKIIENNNISDDFIINDKHDCIRFQEFINFIQKYNIYMKRLTWKTRKKFTLLKEENTNVYYDNFVNKICLTINNLHKILHAINKTHNRIYEIENIIKYPYNFIDEEYQLITFKKLLVINDNFNLNLTKTDLIKAWTIDLFLNGEVKKHYISKTDFIQNLKEYDCDNYNNYYVYLNNEKIIKYLKNHYMITLTYIYNIEKEITNILIDNYYDNINRDYDYDIIEHYIEEYEKKINNENIVKGNYEEEEDKYELIEKENIISKSLRKFTLNKEQRNAIHSKFKNKFNIITGFPGTGKSAVSKCIIWIIKKINKQANIDVIILAPTGKAYVNIKKEIEQFELNCFNEKLSGTCHRIVYHQFMQYIKNLNYEKYYEQDNDKDNDEDNDEEVDFNNIKHIIIDEVSMIDTLLFHKIIIMATTLNCSLTLVGDPQQLPSVQPGKILKALIECNLFQVDKLIKIMRQTNSLLLTNIQIMACGKNIDFNNFDDKTFIIEDIENLKNDNNDISPDKLLKLLEKYNYSKDTSYCLSFYKNLKYITSIFNISNIIQNNYNKKNRKDYILYKEKDTFRIGDKIMRTDNDYLDKDFKASGETAQITKFSDKDGYVFIRYEGDDYDKEISFETLYKSFILNYCITTHKSQGSQYDTCFVFAENFLKCHTTRELIYTAVSRAKQRCIIIGNTKQINKIQDNKHKTYSLILTPEFLDFE